MHGYLAFYRGQKLEIYADSLGQAKDKAVAAFRVKPKLRHLVSVVLCELNVGANGKAVEAVA